MRAMTNLKNSRTRVAIVGAGMSGLVCAQALLEAEIEVTVFDKGRFAGGRLASRQRDQFSFDYGAQYFSARDVRFRKFVAGLIRHKSVRKWKGKFAKFSQGHLAAQNSSHARYVGVPLMRAIVEDLSASLNCQMQHRVTSVSRENGLWSIDGINEVVGESFVSEGFDFLVLNMPPQQASALWPNSQLADIRLLPCIAVLLAFEERIAIEFDGISLDDSQLSWVARDSSKPGRSEGERWVLHASAAWSQVNLQSDDVALAQMMTERFATTFKLDLPAIKFSKVHKWKYALPDNPVAVGCLVDAPESVIYCGDWCEAPRVEGAFLSGIAAAEQILEAFGAIKKL